MKVVETIERDCCEDKDLKPYKGEYGPSMALIQLSFCKHCGQVWREWQEGYHPNAHDMRDRVTINKR